VVKELPCSPCGSCARDAEKCTRMVECREWKKWFRDVWPIVTERKEAKVSEKVGDLP
jgi:hypothetical protein